MICRAAALFAGPVRYLPSRRRHLGLTLIARREITETQTNTSNPSRLPSPLSGLMPTHRSIQSISRLPPTHRDDKAGTCKSLDFFNLTEFA
jgi:hypothetical protein